MKYLILLFLLLTSCSEKNFLVTRVDVSNAECFCNRLGTVVFDIIRNSDRIVFTCFNKKESFLKQYYILDDTVMKQCSKDK